VAVPIKYACDACGKQGVKLWIAHGVKGAPSRCLACVKADPPAQAWVVASLPNVFPRSVALELWITLPENG
jgi:hypothetical protein